MKTVFKSKIGLVVFITILLLANISFGQATKSTVFKQANKAKQNAISVNAEILSPVEYAEALKYYEDANRSFEKGKATEKVEAKLTHAIIYFNKAIEYSLTAEIIFANTLNARKDALLAGANIYANDLWLQAENHFMLASTELDRGDISNSFKESNNTIAIYREAELLAIRTNLIDETRKLLQEAVDIDVINRAPITMNKSKLLLVETENELTSKANDMDYPHMLAKQAKYEAKHAIFLFETIGKIENDKIEMEDVLLKSEQPLINIAEAIGFVAELDEGFIDTEFKIVGYISDLKLKNSTLYFENKEQEYLIENLQATIDVMKRESSEMNQEFKSPISKRSGAMKAKALTFENEKIEIAKKNNYQSKISALFEDMHTIFDSTEVVVLRSEDNVLIRLHGLDFEVGKTEIIPSNFELLLRVEQAINSVPNCQLIVEGNTDSFGSDSLNMDVSQQRSIAVANYLKEKIPTLNISNITSIGNGENNPIANNETNDGRRKNRRIDITIKPTF